MAFFNIDREKYIESGLVTEREHPIEPYVIYNYTPECQYGRKWDEVTVQCRGLIVHKHTREIIARPFSKFFNYEEHVERGDVLPNEIPIVYDKRDGSLGILYWGTDGQPYIATRGSFSSDQALWATHFFRTRHMITDGFDKTKTYLFEIIYPENRIVLDYAGREGLDLLAVIDTESGRSEGIRHVAPHVTHFGVPIEEVAFESYEKLKKSDSKNKEGFVLWFPNADMRVKVKLEEYVKLHKIITGLSEIGIWEMLRDGKTVLEIMRGIPDEMYSWANPIIAKLLERYVSIETSADIVIMEAQDDAKYPTRKDKALRIQSAQYPSVVFAMLDKKPYAELIWKMIRPKGSVTFRKDIDA